MSTALHDVASAAFVAAGLYPDTQTSSPTGPTIDMISADGQCFAIQQIGDISADGVLSGHIEESADGTNWTAISGAVFDDVIGDNTVQVIRFMRSERYVRYAATLTGSSPSVVIAVLIGEQKKTL